MAASAAAAAAVLAGERDKGRKLKHAISAPHVTEAGDVHQSLNRDDTSLLKQPWFLRIPSECDRLKSGLANKQGIDQTWGPCGLILTADRLFVCRRAPKAMTFDGVLDSIPLDEIAMVTMTSPDSMAGQHLYSTRRHSEKMNRRLFVNRVTGKRHEHHELDASHVRRITVTGESSNALSNSFRDTSFKEDLGSLNELTAAMKSIEEAQAANAADTVDTPKDDSSKLEFVVTDAEGIATVLKADNHVELGEWLHALGQVFPCPCSPFRLLSLLILSQNTKRFTKHAIIRYALHAGRARQAASVYDMPYKAGYLHKRGHLNTAFQVHAPAALNLQP